MYRISRVLLLLTAMAGFHAVVAQHAPAYCAVARLEQALIGRSGTP
jgi:hypothetical protein